MRIIKLNHELDQVKRHDSIISKPQMILSSFSKRKEDDNESLVGLLDDLSRCDPEKQIEKLEQEKKAL
jgi:predicted KAP-like P-loop ATPase